MDNVSCTMISVSTVDCAVSLLYGWLTGLASVGVVFCCNQ